MYVALILNVGMFVGREPFERFGLAAGHQQTPVSTSEYLFRLKPSLIQSNRSYCFTVLISSLLLAVDVGNPTHTFSRKKAINKLLCAAKTGRGRTEKQPSVGDVSVTTSNSYVKSMAVTQCNQLWSLGASSLAAFNCPRTLEFCFFKFVHPQLFIYIYIFFCNWITCNWRPSVHLPDSSRVHKKMFTITDQEY